MLEGAGSSLAQNILKNVGMVHFENNPDRNLGPSYMRGNLFGIVLEEKTICMGESSKFPKS